MKKVSIIIPIYKVERYVAECIGSVFRQTYDHSMIECIIVDDCTPDRSMEIVNGMIDEYKNDGGLISFEIIRHDTNQGLSAARNSGISRATGEFIMFVDSDDYLYPDSIKTFLSDYHTRYPDAELIIGNYHDEPHDAPGYNIDSHKVVRDNNYLFVGKLKVWTAWNYMVRRSVIADHNLRFEVGIYYEDNAFNYALLSVINYAVVFPEKTYFYRKNAEGIIQNVNKEKINKSVRDYLKIIGLMLDGLEGRYFIGKSMSIFFLSMQLTDYIRHYKAEITDAPDMAAEIRRKSRQLIMSNLRHGKVLLFLLSLMLVNPFQQITRLHLVRRYFNNIAALYWRPSLAYNKLLHRA
ncbi:MAG: glycosyltransferase family 2 protein [Prevotella sp.]